MEWIDAAAASERLGVKPATLYAYVSRGVVQRRHSEDGRRSLFSAEEIERLARRGRPRAQPPELVIESAVTSLGVDRPYYRGADALALAGTAPFETVAEWLWTGDPAIWHRPARPRRPKQQRPAGLGRSLSDGPGRSEERALPAGLGRSEERALPDGLGRSEGREISDGLGRFEGRALSDGPGRSESLGGPEGPQGPGIGQDGWRFEPGDGLRAACAAQRGLPGDLLPLDRLQVIVTVLGASDSLRYQLDPASVTATARRLIAGMVDAMPPLRDDDTQGGTIAERLWTRLSPHPAGPGLLDALRAALVLLADHELAASTLAARVAASAKADPYAVVLTGLGVLSGPLHGGASYAAERLLAEITHPGEAPRVIGERLRRGERIPGFGHSVYKSGDARATLLLDLLKKAVMPSDGPAGERIAALDAVLAEMRRRRLPHPNVDLALATLVTVSGMTRGAGEAIFAVARAAGWLAHAMEEYRRGSLLRLRASYTGPPPR
ncbi:citrate synthase [Nonomuraea salmonea]|uniref:citrate synthase (unknown stereospecificity) n=1 Tax=Nonomuraea salmonea TaxID=46181 RepID=A0ABV5NR13_9ACTN